MTPDPALVELAKVQLERDTARAECERPRAADAEWSDLCNQQTELLEAKLKLGQTHACGWCVMAAGDTEEARNAVEKMTLDAVRSHALTCANNPLVAERDALRLALVEALDWATRFDGRHDRQGGYASELMPMFVRIGDRYRDERIAELRKLVTP